MRKKQLFVLVAIVALIIGLLITASVFSKTKTDWNKKFGKENKSPFGFYILYNELKQLTQANKVSEIKTLEELKNLDPKTDIIFFINENPNQSTVIVDEINKLYKKPFTIFYAEENQFNTLQTSEKPIIVRIKEFSTNTNYNSYTNKASFNHTIPTHKALGTVSINDSTYTNYYLNINGKMLEYTHFDPILFSNFYILKENGYLYTKEVFKPLKGKNIYWINPNRTYTQPKSSSALSFILSQPELKTAWYILVFALLLYLIFKSKREQQYIPVVEPEKNLSLDFANVIASMYYESGKPHDIITKKIDYFYHTIRKEFNLSTENIFDENFVFVLAQKAQITTEETVGILTELKNLYENKKTVLKDVHRTHEIIENYKNKAHIL